MKPAPFEFVRPTTVEEACSLLSEAGGAAQVIAGGQTLMPMLALRISQPLLLVDLGAIASLKGVTQTDGAVRIGAMTRQSEALADPILNRALPTLVTALRQVGHHQTRNRGTIGGSIALGEPAAEMPATAVALDAAIEIASPSGTRSVPACDFYIGPYATVLEADEIVTGIRYPGWPQSGITIFREVAQRPGDFALVGLVGTLVVDGGRITRSGLAWFGMGPTPIRARAAETTLLDREVGSIDWHAVADLTVAETAPFDDAHVSADYRRTVARRIFARTLGEATGERLAA